MIEIAGGIILAVVALMVFAAFPAAILRTALVVGAIVVLFPLALALENRPLAFLELFGGAIAVAFAALFLLRPRTKPHP